MAHRSIGQERFGFAGRERAASSLEALVSAGGLNATPSQTLNPFR